MKHFGTFLANLRSSAGIAQADMATLADTSRSTISRLENDEIPRPLKGPLRKTAFALAEILCTSRKEAERYLELAEIDRATLTDSEEAQLGFIRLIMQGAPDEREELARWEQVYAQRLEHLERRGAVLGIGRMPPRLKLKIQEYANLLAEIQRRRDRLANRAEPGPSFAMPIAQIHYTAAPGGRIVVGHQYADEQFNTPIPANLYALASPNARWLMELAEIERFAVDDCINLTRSRNFAGWNPEDIETTVLSAPLSILEELQKVQQEKLPLITKDFYNSSHYRLVSYTPYFSDSDRLAVTLAPMNFYDYYSLTPFLDEPILTALDGSQVSIRQKYGNTALKYSSADKGTSLIPTPISLQCIVVTKDRQILLMQRSSSVAFYPRHWSATFEENMNAPGMGRKNIPSRSDDASFFAGALRGLEEELALTLDAVESIKMLSLNVEYLTLSVDVIILINVALTSQEIKESWLVKAWDMDEASRFDLLPAELPAVVDKLFSRTLWHPTSRMRLIQYLFHAYGVDEVAKAFKARRGE